MRPHIHTGFDTFIAVTVMAWLGLALLRLAAAEMADMQNDTARVIGKALGATL